MKEIEEAQNEAEEQEKKEPCGASVFLRVCFRLNHTRRRLQKDEFVSSLPPVFLYAQHHYSRRL